MQDRAASHGRVCGSCIGPPPPLLSLRLSAQLQASGRQHSSPNSDTHTPALVSAVRTWCSPCSPVRSLWRKGAILIRWSRSANAVYIHREGTKCMLRVESAGCIGGPCQTHPLLSVTLEFLSYHQATCSSSAERSIVSTVAQPHHRSSLLSSIQREGNATYCSHVSCMFWLNPRLSVLVAL